MPMHLFTYGTLMFPEVWQAVVGKDFETTPAQLPGYQIFRVRDAVYPGIIAIDPSPTRERLGEGATEPAELARKKGEGGSSSSGSPISCFLLPPYSASGSRPSALDSRLSTVPGLLYLDVDPASFARLDRFEGEDYRRQSVLVACEDGRELEAATYIIPPEKNNLLTDEPWIAAEFQRRGDLPRFVAKYAGFNRLD